MIHALTLALLLALPASAGEAPPGNEKKEQKAQKGQKEAPAQVFTNADLDRMYGPPSRRGGEGVEYDRALFGEEALEALLEGEDQTLPARRSQAEQAYVAARDRVDYLQQKIAYIRNPLLTPPRLTEEDRAEEQGMGAMAKVARSEAQLQESQAALEMADSVLRGLGGTPPPVVPREPRGVRTITVTGERDDLPED